MGGGEARTRSTQALPELPELPTELWQLVIDHNRPTHGLLAACRATRDATYALVQLRHRLTFEQAVAFIRVVILRKHTCVHGGPGTGKLHVARVIADRMASTLRNQPGAVAIVAPTEATAFRSATKRVAAHTLNTFLNLNRTPRPVGSPRVVGTQRPTDDDVVLALAGFRADLERNEPARGLVTAVVDDTTRTRLCAAQLLVLTEASLLCDETLQLVHEALCFARCSRAPFGGLIVLLVADFATHVPERGARYLFEAPLWRHVGEVRLTRSLRQAADPPLACLLARVRAGMASQADVDALNRQTFHAPPRPAGLVLCATEEQAVAANDVHIDTLPGPARVYEVRRQLDVVLRQSPFLRRMLYTPRPTDKVVWPQSGASLRLKVGALVSATRPLHHSALAQTGVAQTGRVTHLGANHVHVAWFGHNGDPPLHTRVPLVHCVRRQRFRSKNGHFVLASQWRLPLKLAYARTVESARALSIDFPVDLALVDRTERDTKHTTDRATKRAAAYLALGRVTSLAHVRLRVPLRLADLRVCPVVRARFETRKGA